MKRRISFIDDVALSGLGKGEMRPRLYSDWIRIVRGYLRMTQAELARRAGVSQSHIAAIETGKLDPRVGTLAKIFDALSCGIDLKPQPRKPLPEVLLGRARKIALKRLKPSAGTMALENQAPDEETFRHLLEKQAQEILQDPRERLWDKDDE